MKCDICGKENDCVEINFCKLCAFEFNNNTKKIKNDLAIYKKALELACEKWMNDVNAMMFLDTGIQVNNKYELHNYLIQQAKEELN